MNVTANVELFRAFLPGMRARKWGRVLFSSSAATISAPSDDHMSMYTATKGALNSFTKAAANEVGPDGITVNTLVLGPYLTDLVQEAIEGLVKVQGPEAATAFKRSFATTTSLDRMGESHEVEGVVQLLASNAGGYITASNLFSDGA